MASSVDEMLRRLDGDRQLLRQIAAIFVDDCPRQLERLRQAIQEGRHADADAAAHSLKGAIANFDTGEALQSAAAIEAATRLGQPIQLNADFERLDKALSALIEVLRTV